MNVYADLEPPQHLRSFFDSLLAENAVLPRVVCFDLDWTLLPLFLCRTAGPPFRLLEGQKMVDAGNTPVSFLPDVPGIILFLARLQARRNIDLAIASRSEAPHWYDVVLQTLPLFPASMIGRDDENHVVLTDLVSKSYLQIIPRLSKKIHLKNIVKSSRGLSHSDILFFDDEPGNVREATALGVTSVLVDRRSQGSGKSRHGVGLTFELFAEGLRKYAESRRSASLMTSWLKGPIVKQKDNVVEDV